MGYDFDKCLFKGEQILWTGESSPNAPSADKYRKRYDRMLCLLVFVLWYRKRKRFNGEMTLIYLGGYGLGRFLIEGLRTDQLLIPGTDFPVSQGLSAVIVLGCIILTVAIRSKKKKAAD